MKTPRSFVAAGLVMAAAILSLAVTACSHPNLGGPPENDGEPPAPALRLSPNGEPLTGGLACGDAIRQWFMRIDGNHDGRVDRAEFLADARAQFERMDLDHDGAITADELSAFRAPFLERAREEERDGTGRRHAGEAGSPESGEARPGNGTDPVMSADTNLDFKVSLAEFLKQAADVFDRLDTGHGGSLGPQEVEGICRAPF